MDRRPWPEEALWLSPPFDKPFPGKHSLPTSKKGGRQTGRLPSYFSHSLSWVHLHLADHVMQPVTSQSGVTFSAIRQVDMTPHNQLGCYLGALALKNKRTSRDATGDVIHCLDSKTFCNMFPWSRSALLHGLWRHAFVLTEKFVTLLQLQRRRIFAFCQREIRL